MPGYRWVEALRIIRKEHSEVTIILPGEKIAVHPGDDVRALLTPHVHAICRMLDEGTLAGWNGYTLECRVRQLRSMLGHYFYFHAGSISEEEINALLFEWI